MQIEVQQGLLNLQLAVVVDQAQLSKLVRDKIYARSSGVNHLGKRLLIWPAPGSADTELGVLMGPEVSYGETEVYTRVQA
jgi:hypothetical protein